ncbi:MAG: hypothetical protein WCP53_06605 [Verrucomicrobiota bacterium]
MRTILANGNMPDIDYLAARRRTETTQTFHRDGVRHTLVVRSKVAVEDPYLMLVKATAESIRGGVDLLPEEIPRSIRDFLVRSNVNTRS